MPAFSTQMTEEELSKWERKRRYTFITYLMQMVENGMSKSMIVAILWMYLNSEVKSDHKKLYYGVISCVDNLTPILFTVPLARWVDKTRNAKQAIIVCNIFRAIGQILFSIPYSPFFLMFGRFLDGFLVTLRPVFTAEVSRSYPSDELQSKQSLITFCYLFGHSIGPLFALCLSNVDVTIGGLHISWGNSCSIFLFVMCAIQMISSLLLSDNLSKEYDLKGHELELDVNLTSDENGDDNVDDKIDEFAIESEEQDLLPNNTAKYNQKKNGSSIEIIKKIICNGDTLILLSISVMMDFWASVFFRGTPYLILHVINFSKKAESIWYFGYAFVCMVTSLVIAKIKTTSKFVFHLGLFGFAALFVICFCFRFITKSSSELL